MTMSGQPVPVPSDASARTGYQIARKYWNQQSLDAPELVGVAAIGGGGITEVLYRHHEEVRHLHRVVRLDRDHTMLELGSGNGRWALSLAPLIRDYVAVDFSKQMLDLARERAAGLGLTNIRFQESAAEDYVPDTRFDVVYLSGVSQYLHDDDLTRLLQRLRGAIKPGGVVVDRSTVHRRARVVTENVDYFSIYRTPDELRGVFSAAGWTPGYHRPSYRFLNFPAPIQRLLGRRNCARLVRAAAPLSFHFLRLLALAGSFIFKPTGEVLDFSHDFFLFHPEQSPDARK